MPRAAASGSRAKASITARPGASVATVSEVMGRKPTPGASVPISSQRRRARRATSSSSPDRRPLTQTRPKLRTEAPVGPASASRWSTANPASASSSVCQVPTMPPPATTARRAVTRDRWRRGPRPGWRRRPPTAAAARRWRCRPPARWRRRHGHRRGGGVDPAVHLDVDLEAVRRDRGPHLCDLRHHVRDEALPPEAREDRHAQDEIDVAQVGLHRLEGRIGVEGQARPQAQAAHLRDELVRVADLDVDRAAVGPGVGEVLQVPAGLGHHEVAVEEERRVAPQRRHHGRPDRHVGDEVPVHHVDVEPVGGRRHLADLLGQQTEVRRQHRRCDAQVAGATGVPLRRGCRSLQRSAAPAQVKRAQQRMRRNP